MSVCLPSIRKCLYGVALGLLGSVSAAVPPTKAEPPAAKEVATFNNANVYVTGLGSRLTVLVSPDHFRHFEDGTIHYDESVGSDSTLYVYELGVHETQDPFKTTLPEGRSVEASSNTITVDGSAPSSAFRLLGGDWVPAATIDRGLSMPLDDGFAVLRTRLSKMAHSPDDDTEGSDGGPRSEEESTEGIQSQADCGPSDERPCQEVVVYRFIDGVQLSAEAAWQLEPGESATAISGTATEIYIAVKVPKDSSRIRAMYIYAKGGSGEWIKTQTVELHTPADTDFTGFDTRALLPAPDRIFAVTDTAWGPEGEFYKVAVDVIAKKRGSFAFAGRAATPEQTLIGDDAFSTDRDFEVDGEKDTPIFCVRKNELLGIYGHQILRLPTGVQSRWLPTRFAAAIPEKLTLRALACLDRALVVVAESGNVPAKHTSIYVVPIKSD